MTASTTTLKIVGYKGSPWVTLWYHLNGSPKYLPALATMVRQYQYVQRIRIVLGMTPYTAMITRHMS